MSGHRYVRSVVVLVVVMLRAPDVNGGQDDLRIEFPIAVVVDSPRSRVCWADPFTRSIHHVGLDGGVSVGAVPGDVGAPCGLALDDATGTLYWSDFWNGTIKRAGIAGSNAAEVVTGLPGPWAVAIDPATKSIYWTDLVTRTIERIPAEGTGRQIVVNGLDAPTSLAIDSDAGKLYWTDAGMDKIQRADLDGGAVEDLVTSAVSIPRSIAVDPTVGRIYWVDEGTATIHDANLDGSDLTSVIPRMPDPRLPKGVVVQIARPHGIAIDVEGDGLIWSDGGAHTIYRSDRSGLNTTALGPCSSSEHTESEPVAAMAGAHTSTEANALWWGFHPSDATAALQGAIDSGADSVQVPRHIGPWIVEPIFLRTGLELKFESGTRILARASRFRGRSDDLFEARDATDITLSGYGATLRMRKVDYQNAPYEPSEHRHALRFQGCERITIEGLTIASSGGDGIYLGSTAALPRCEDVVIRDVVCDDHHRQGMSVISAENLLIQNCLFANTRGTPPAAGIDLEPNRADEKLVNCVIRDCVMEDNDGYGWELYLRYLSRDSDDVSVLFDNCVARGVNGIGIRVGPLKDDGPKGTIEFRNCLVEGTRNEGTRVFDMALGNVRTRFVNCTWRDCGGPAPIRLLLRDPAFWQFTETFGGIDFVNCRVCDDRPRPVLLLEEDASDFGVHDVTGRIDVYNPNFGPWMFLGSSSTQISVLLERSASPDHCDPRSPVAVPLLDGRSFALLCMLLMAIVSAHVNRHLNGRAGRGRRMEA